MANAQSRENLRSSHIYVKQPFCMPQIIYIDQFCVKLDDHVF